MGLEIPSNAVLVEDKQPLEERLRDYPLGPGEVYYFVSCNLPTMDGLSGIFGEINLQFKIDYAPNLPNSGSSGIVGGDGTSNQSS